MIHWILYGGQSTGSSRIHGYRIHEYLRNANYHSNILVSPPFGLVAADLPWRNSQNLWKKGFFSEKDTVIFETVRGHRAIMLAEQLHNQGVRVVFVDCDLHHDTTIINYCDEVICSSAYLANIYSQRHRRPIKFIPDAVEFIISQNELDRRTRIAWKGLQIAWIGNRGHWDTLSNLRTLLKEKEFSDFHLLTVSNHRMADIPWTLTTTKRVLQTCDAIVIPTESTPEAWAKSNNRVTQAMALGAPVLAGHIPAYEEIINPGQSGFLCDTLEDWANGLRALRDPSLRDRIAHYGWELAKSNYLLPLIGAQWIKVVNMRSYIEVNQPKLPISSQVESMKTYMQDLFLDNPITKKAYHLLRTFFH